MRYRDKEYVHNRIENMLYSKTLHFEFELRHYFEHRHVGLAGGIDPDMTKGLLEGAIRDLKVWRRITQLCNNNYKL